jgi:hypothetical protein
VIQPFTDRPDPEEDDEEEYEEEELQPLTTDEEEYLLAHPLEDDWETVSTRHDEW